MAALAHAGCRKPSRASSRLLPALAVAVLLGLVAAPAGRLCAFATPRLASSPAGRAVLTAVPALGSQDVGSASIGDQVESLRRESLEACLLATEGDKNSVERCSALSYELAQAEQLLFKRQASFRMSTMTATEKRALHAGPAAPRGEDDAKT
eukprot:CAMPEP_0171262758 /NCGR_PEP_ID=MMETSP0790-20130122/56737_1 /TAXON_ID=2925 /ORGANISM="Alexandrium catenella, Strain OF101" /LENGTH=151 /DNA_ID=CAMNT_0011731331 /DNA_START=81 /DNA_END=533 /DNA_ORIENTATION=-